MEDDSKSAEIIYLSSYIPKDGTGPGLPSIIAQSDPEFSVVELARHMCSNLHHNDRAEFIDLFPRHAGATASYTDLIGTLASKTAADLTSGARRIPLGKASVATSLALLLVTLNVNTQMAVTVSNARVDVAISISSNPQHAAAPRNIASGWNVARSDDWSGTWNTASDNRNWPA